MFLPSFASLAINSKKLEGATWESPPGIGSGIPNSIVLTTLNATSGSIGTLGITTAFSSAAISLTANGNATTPIINWSTNTGLGLYRVTTDQLGVACNGANVAIFTTAGLSLTGELSVSNGTGT